MTRVSQGGRKTVYCLDDILQTPTISLALVQCVNANFRTGLCGREEDTELFWGQIGHRNKENVGGPLHFLKNIYIILLHLFSMRKAWQRLALWRELACTDASFQDKSGIMHQGSASQLFCVTFHAPKLSIYGPHGDISNMHNNYNKKY